MNYPIVPDNAPLAIVTGTTQSPRIVLESIPERLRPWALTLGATLTDDGRFCLDRGQRLDAAFEQAGLIVVDEAGEQAEVGDLELPLVVVSGQVVEIYPRLMPVADVGAALPGAIWDAAQGRFEMLLPDGGMDAALRAVLEKWTWWYRPVAAPTPAAALRQPQPHRSVGAAPVPFDTDGTVAALHGVSMSDLDAVDPTTVAGLAGMGIVSAYDLLHTVPRGYLDRSNPQPVDRCSVGEQVAFVGEVVSVKTPPRGSSGASIVKVRDTGSAHKQQVSLTWFNAAWIAKKFRVGDRLLVSGVLGEWVSQSGYCALQVRNPICDRIDGDGSDMTNAVIGVYPASGKHGVTTWSVRRAAKEAAQRLPPTTDPVPRNMTLARGLPDRHTALVDLHLPATMRHAQSARRRIAYDELLRWQLALAGSHRALGASAGIAHVARGELWAKVLGVLPYSLTGAQQRSVSEIAADLSAPHPMNRLLQGEVGSGKTLVSLLAMLHAVDAGSSAALMAPTEALAAQHHRDFAELADGIELTDSDGVTRPVRVELLTNKITGRARKQVLAGLADGSVDIVVGTSSLLAEQVQFHRLGLVVVDEQHRFGVEQRKALTDKATGGAIPDLLVMTATPVPRTALITAFGDLDVSVLDELPPGRSPIVTHCVDPDQLTNAGSAVWASVTQALNDGRQVFVVTPSIADSEAKSAKGADVMAAEVSTLLPGRRIGVAHGKQTPAERSAVMDAMRAGTLDVLVATSVIEVGVNIPNATVMVVTGAEHFGITQLHQLRGRVGRGQHAGKCWLVPSKPASTLADSSQSRLQALVDSTDGFELARRDLAIRGAGSLTGTKQSGKAGDLKVADLLTDTDLIEWSRADAQGLIESDPQLRRHPTLRAEIEDVIGQDGIDWLGTR
ncbi:ATP-dependent DNA helicase RecG [Branchiibius sp. NY16-3462-2]|uniref:ATP-dependent DNA helicase RecG n=1 Tax=Branchiibius sp. NY16-3462-2 TaxID=1807500 RepID=UPI00079BF7FB|nr:ATP-dependent DNA helicase RecG [Branchiibius sp. NY16-3462-2]KYH43866.1 hypothetical protein AZH51_15650 [Branchiibius sp. NY16-3462-2]